MTGENAPIVFAHRGAPSPTVGGNSLAAFAAALRAGADGLEADIHLTADGVPVLLHGTGLIRGRPIAGLTRAQVPPRIPSLEALWVTCGTNFELALDMVSPSAAPAVLALAQRYGATSHLWLTYWRLPLMARWQQRWPDVHTVYATFLGLPSALLRRTAARSAAAGIDALNLHQRLVGPHSAGIVHAAGLKLFAWGVRNERQRRRVQSLGVDGLFVDTVSPSR